jgi:hypothetical protein
MQLIEHNIVLFVAALIIGSIPREVHVRNKSSKRKRCNIELKAYLWQFTRTEQGWSLRITGVGLLSQKLRDDLDHLTE